MTVPLNCLRMVTRVGEKIENRTQATWFPVKVLEAIDEAVQALVIVQQEAKEDYELDYLDVSVTAERAAGAMRETGQGSLEWQLPPLIHKVRRIENTTGGENVVEIPSIQLHMKDNLRATRFGGSQSYWFFSKGGTVNTRIGFTTTLAGVETMRIWFMRRVAPLHYGTADAPPNTTVSVLSAAGQKVLSVTATTRFVAGMRVRIDEGLATDEVKEIGSVGTGVLNLTENLTFAHAALQTVRACNVVTFGATPTAGRLVLRNDVYIGASVEITNNLPAGIQDATGVCRDYIAATRDAVFDTDIMGTSATMSGAPSQATYALVAQIEPEHHELVWLAAATRLAGEAGSERIMGIVQAQYGPLYENFINALPDRQDQTARFVHHYEDEFGL